METVDDFKDLGFVEIPGFSRYLISKEGVVVNKETGKLLKGSMNPAGYLNFTLQKDVVGHFTIGKHRLLGLAFLHPGCDVSNLVINHKDGVKSNCELDNLEWVTPIENNHHAGAMGLNSHCKPVQVRNTETGDVKSYPSANACSRERGLKKDSLLRRLSFPESKVYADRCQYRWSKKDQEWTIPENVELEILKNGTCKSVAVKFLLENRTIIFDSVSAAAQHLNIALSTLSGWLSFKGQPTLPGFIQVKFLIDEDPWREVDDPYFDLMQNSRSCIIRVIDESGQEKLYSNCVECAKDNGLLTTTLNERLKSNGKKIYKDGKRYSRYVSYV